MNTKLQRVKAVFLEAVEKYEPDQWAPYLDRACGQDQDLRENVQVLLDAHVGGQSLLDKGAINPAVTLEQTVSERVGAVIGPYKLLQKLGEGGMGVVYMAEQNEPVKRRVALKIIKPGMDTSQVIARFEAERQALAIMDHPHIAKVLDAGATETGRPYFVMELVKGVPLTQYCDEQHFTPRQRLELFVLVCQAVQHAHQKGIIHRDLKPGNVLVAEYDQQAVPKVIDFGVAKATSQQLTEKTMFTKYGQIVGTLEYMSPEQAKLNQLDIDTRSDVYSLGVLLYELLVGTTPFDRQRLRSAAFEEVLRIIREEEPPKPSIRLSTLDTVRTVATQRKTEPQKLSTQVRGELDWIVMKALEKDRGRRYETASGFAADIQRYLDDEPVVACPPSAGYRFRKFARRNKAVLATGVMIVASLLAGLVSTLWQWSLTEGQRVIADQERVRAEQETERAQQARDEADQQRSRAEQETEKAQQARDEADRKSQELDVAFREATVMRLAAESRSARADSPVRSLLLARESVLTSQRLLGNVMPIARETLLSAVPEVGGRPLIGHDSGVYCAVIGPDGRRFATGAAADGGQVGEVRVWDFQNTDQPSLVLGGLKGPIHFEALAFTPRGDRLVAGCRDSSVRIWELKANDPNSSFIELTGHMDRVVCVAVSRDGRRLATASFDRTARVWDLTTDDPEASPSVLEGHVDTVWTVDFSPDGRWLATGSADATARLWDLDAGDPVATHQVLAGHTGPLGARFSLDGRLLVTYSDDATARLWNLTADDPRASVTVLKGHQAHIWSPRFSPDGRWLATVSNDETARLWDLHAANPSAHPLVLRGHKGQVWDCRFSPDGRRLFTGGADGIVRLWDVTAADPAARPVVLRGHDLRVNSLAISPDGRRVVSASWDGARLWDLDAELPGRSSLVLRGHQDLVKQIAFTPDGRRLVTSSWDTTTRVWELTAANPASAVRVLTGTGRPGGSSGLAGWGRFAISQDGKWLATGSGGTSVQLWDLENLNGATAAPAAVLTGHQDAVHSLAFSADNRRLVTGGVDGTARVWDLETDPISQIHVLPGHDIVQTVVVGSEGRWVLTHSQQRSAAFGGAKENIARLWDLDAPDPESPLVLRGHRQKIHATGISPDGRWAVTTSSDQTARLWDLHSTDPAESPLVLEGHTHVVRHALFSPDGRWLFTGSNDETVRVWDLSAPDPTAAARVLRGHDAGSPTLTISADGRWLLTRAGDRTSRVWDLDAADSHETSFALLSDTHQWCAAISPDGRWAATGNDDNTVRLWDLDLDSVLDRANSVIGRELTTAERKRYLLDVASEAEQKSGE